MQILNLGKRLFHIGKQVLEPQKVIELAEEQAKKFIAMYPAEIVALEVKAVEKVVEKVVEKKAKKATK